MKPSPVSVFTFVVLLSLPSTMVLGDAATHAQLIKERDAVLTQIVSQEESKVVRDESAIFAAKVALYSFRRDVGATKEEKLKQQMLIVGLYEQKLVAVKARAEIGIVGPVDVLKATDEVLSEKVRLEELKADGKSG